jgi:hypothetical protein
MQVGEIMSDVDANIGVRYKNGSTGSVRVIGTERTEGESDGIDLKFIFDSGLEQSFFSEISVFDALRRARLEFDVAGIMLLCSGSARDVYPSPMQQAMGLNTLAYRNSIGSQAKSADIVDIFASENDANCVTVSEQDAFHQEWLKSLR